MVLYSSIKSTHFAAFGVAICYEIYALWRKKPKEDMKNVSNFY